MLRPRISPCLLLRSGGLVKTTKFTNDKYVGDPINAVKIFNEKSVDELIILDIDATTLGVEPDYNLIERLANECRMPLCYGGGIKTLEQAERLVRLGVEKIAVSSAFLTRPSLISELCSRLGSQSVVAILDVRCSLLGKYHIFTNNGKKKSANNLLDFIEQCQHHGVGEIIINSIDKDGSMSGYDTDLINLVSDNIRVPFTALGGAGSMDDFGDLIEKFGTVGCSAGSFFVFKGKYKAVLISYPSFEEKYQIIADRLGKFEACNLC